MASFAGFLPIFCFSQMLHMALMIELHMIREHMNFHPIHRLTSIKLLSQLLNGGLVRRDHRVAIHANIETGHRGMSRFFNIGVTVKAWNLVSACMQFMGVRNRLIGLEPSVVANVPPFHFFTTHT